MEPKKLALLCREYAENRKAENIAILDVRKVSGVTDYFVICTGTSDPHLRAIVNEVTDRLRDDHKIKAHAVDGAGQGSWVVMDFFDVILHVMRTDIRQHYDLESLWGDAPRMKTRKPAKAKKETAAAKAPSLG